MRLFGVSTLCYAHTLHLWNQLHLLSDKSFSSVAKTGQFPQRALLPYVLKSIDSQFAERLRYRPGVHHLHRGDQPVPVRPALGGAILPDAVHPWH